MNEEAKAASAVDLIYFVREREIIRKAKDAGLPPPWTSDWILREYRFTNIRRKDDRVSRWLLKHVLLSTPVNHPQYVALVALCRFINWPPTIQALLDAGLIRDPLPWRRIGAFLDKRCASDNKTWSAAYMIKGNPMGKGMFIATTLQKGFKKHGAAIQQAIASNRCAIVHAALLQVPECGKFLAGQIVADLTYTPLLSRAKDLYTWAPLGPGSRRGFNRLLGIEPIHKWPDEQQFIANLVKWRQLIINKLGREYFDLTLMDVQNVCCEIDKYLRVRNGEGKPRARYTSHVGEYAV